MGRAPLGGVGRTPWASRRVEVYDIGWGIKTFSILMNKLFLVPITNQALILFFTHLISFFKIFLLFFYPWELSGLFWMDSIFSAFVLGFLRSIYSWQTILCARAARTPPRGGVC